MKKIYIKSFICYTTNDVCFYRDYFTTYSEEGLFHEPKCLNTQNNPILVHVEIYQ